MFGDSWNVACIGVGGTPMVVVGDCWSCHRERGWVGEDEEKVKISDKEQIYHIVTK